LDPKPIYSEQELVTLLRARDQQAFGYLYEHYAAALNGIVSSIVTSPETAEDVLQLVFVNIWKRIESYDPAKGRLFTWMLNIARNAAIDEIRSKAHRDQQKNLAIPESGELAEAGFSTAMVQDVGLRKMLTKLKEEYRILLDLAYFQGYTQEEIAQLRQIPLGTVKTRIRSALQQLRTLMN